MAVFTSRNRRIPQNV